MSTPENPTALGTYQVVRPLADVPIGRTLLGTDATGRSVVLTLVASRRRGGHRVPGAVRGRGARGRGGAAVVRGRRRGRRRRGRPALAGRGAGRRAHAATVRRRARAAGGGGHRRVGRTPGRWSRRVARGRVRARRPHAVGRRTRRGRPAAGRARPCPRRRTGLRHPGLPGARAGVFRDVDGGDPARGVGRRGRRVRAGLRARLRGHRAPPVRRRLGGRDAAAHRRGRARPRGDGRARPLHGAGLPPQGPGPAPDGGAGRGHAGGEPGRADRRTPRWNGAAARRGRARADAHRDAPTG